MFEFPSFGDDNDQDNEESDEKYDRCDEGEG